MSISPKKKLVLFDIDGTLITTRGAGIKYWKSSIVKAFAHVGITLPEFDERKLNGMLERRYFRELSDLAGLTREEFEKKFPVMISVFAASFMEAIDRKEFEVSRIDDAYTMVTSLVQHSSVSYGLLTGNNEPLAWHKLRAARFHEQFTFGAYGTEVEHRGKLIQRAIRRAKKHFGHEFESTEIFVIGDTKFDIEAAKYAGVFAIGVTTGLTYTGVDLEVAGADLVVDSLLDDRVSTRLGLPK